MRKFHVLVHTLLLITSPSLFANPPAEQLIIEQVQSDEIPFDGSNLSYDEILRLLDDIESNKIEEYSEEQLEQISQYIAYLAQEGKLPGDHVANAELEKDIAALFEIQSNFWDFDIEENHYASLPSVVGHESFGGYGRRVQHLNNQLMQSTQYVSSKKQEKSKKSEKPKKNEKSKKDKKSKKSKKNDDHKHHHHKNVFAKIKDFVAKHKKAIIIGAAIVVAVAVVVIAVAAAPAVGAAAAKAAASAAATAAATAGAPGEHRASSSVVNTPEFESAKKDQITFFKETLATEGHLNGNLPIEENMRTLGSLFAHQSSHELQQQFVNTPFVYQDIGTKSWYSSNPSGHHEIDKKFSTDYAFNYATPQTDFNTLAYQGRGEKALSFGYYEQAIQNCNKAIDLNPANPLPYLDRGIAHFNLGQYDHSLNDFQNYVSTQQSQPKEAFSVGAFTEGFAKGLPSGIYDSGEGMFLFLADLVQHPIHTSVQIWDSLVILKDLVKTQAWEAISETLSPQVYDLVVNWDQLSSYERGELAGYAFGRYGTDILIPTAVVKAGKTCQELITVSKNLQIAKKTLFLETASAIPNGVKIIEENIQAIALAQDLGLSVNATSQLKQAGALKPFISDAVENLTPELRQSYQLFKQAEKYLKLHGKGYMSEIQAKELINQAGIGTFPRPNGIPDNYRIKISDNGAGIKYIHPEHEHTSVRVMPGKPHSINPNQRKPYVVYEKNGKRVDKFDNVVTEKSLESHIPFDEFVFKE